MAGGVHSVLGGGKVADILLWRNKILTAGILGGYTIVWFLFEVLGYYFLTFVGHVLIISMGILFIWSSAAGLIKRAPPAFNDVRLPESTFKFLFDKVNNFLLALYEMSVGRQLNTFLGTIGFLWIFSVFGSLGSTLSISYVVFLCLATLPALYEKYEILLDKNIKIWTKAVKP